MKTRQLPGRDARLALHALQKLQQLLRLARLVALILLPEDAPALGLDHQRLDGGRADVQANDELRIGCVLRGLCN